MRYKKFSSIEEKGFSLIEVLIAIAVIAFTIPSLMLLMAQQTENAGTLRNKAIATWVADNTLVKYRLERQLNSSVLRSRVEETVTMAGTEWVVAIEPEETESGSLLLYRTTVGLEPDAPLATLETFIH